MKKILIISLTLFLLMGCRDIPLESKLAAIAYKYPYSDVWMEDSGNNFIVKNQAGAYHELWINDTAMNSKEVIDFDENLILMCNWSVYDPNQDFTTGGLGACPY